MSVAMLLSFKWEPDPWIKSRIMAQVHGQTELAERLQKLSDEHFEQQKLQFEMHAAICKIAQRQSFVTAIMFNPNLSSDEVIKLIEDTK